MPEGPESYTIVAGLQSLVGSWLVDIKSDVYSFETHLRVKEIISYGKRPTIVLEVGDGKYIYLMCFLGMTGRLLFEKADPPPKYVRATFTFESGDNVIKLVYDDQRRFGFLEFLKVLPVKGFDLLNQIPSSSEWLESLRSFKGETLICDLLLNDKFNITIGNYLKSEILYLSKVRPDARLRDLTDEQVERLRIVSCEVSRQALEAGGLSIKDYTMPNGQPGAYKCVCYGLPHDDQGRKILKTKFGIGSSKRTTHWCPDLYAENL